MGCTSESESKIFFAAELIIPKKCVLGSEASGFSIGCKNKGIWWSYKYVSIYIYSMSKGWYPGWEGSNIIYQARSLFLVEYTLLQGGQGAAVLAGAVWDTRKQDWLFKKRVE